MGNDSTVHNAVANAGPDAEYDYYKEHKPIFAFTPETYIEHLWFMAIAGTDLMGVLYKDAPDGIWRLTYRFRHYNSMDPWDSKDVKSVYEIKASGSDADKDKLREAFDSLLAATKDKFEVRDYSSLPIMGGPDKFIAALSKQPWAHVKVSSKEGGTVQ